MLKLSEHSLKDRLVNTVLTIFAYVRYALKIKDTTSAVFYKLTHTISNNANMTAKPIVCITDSFSVHDERRSIDTIIKTYFNAGFKWGDVHPTNPTHWWNGARYPIVNSTGICFCLEHEPKTFELDNGDLVTANYKTHMIDLIDGIRHGAVHVKFMLPQGRKLWPAIWLTAVDSWPPEIDILEAWSNDKGRYNKVTTNVHHANSRHRYAIGSVHIPLKHNEFNTVTCEWTDKHIKIYCNGHLVRQCTTPSIIDAINSNLMTLVINNGSDNGKSDTLHSTLIIKELYVTEYVRNDA